MQSHRRDDHSRSTRKNRTVIVELMVDTGDNESQVSENAARRTADRAGSPAQGTVIFQRSPLQVCLPFEQASWSIRDQPPAGATAAGKEFFSWKNLQSALTSATHCLPFDLAEQPADTFPLARRMIWGPRNPRLLLQGIARKSRRQQTRLTRNALESPYFFDRNRVSLRMS